MGRVFAPHCLPGEVVINPSLLAGLPRQEWCDEFLDAHSRLWSIDIIRLDKLQLIVPKRVDIDSPQISSACGADGRQCDYHAGKIGSLPDDIENVIALGIRAKMLGTLVSLLDE